MRSTGTGGRIGLAFASLGFAVILLLAGCTRLLESEGIKFNSRSGDDGPAATVGDGTDTQGGDPGGTAEQPAATTAEDRYRIFRGTGQVIGEPDRTRVTVSEGPDGDITLNFVDADVREVLKATLGGLLGANYVVSPEVQGAVTVQSSRPISREALLPTLEAVLRLNGLAIVLDAGVYRIQPLQGAARGNATLRLGLASAGADDGYSVQIVPLAYVSAAKMAETLRPIAREGAILHIDETRNFMLIGGTRFELAALMEAIDVFDVNWLSGMSFGLFTLEYAEARALSDELTAILGEGGQGPVAGLVRLVPVERMNAILAVSRQPRYLTEVRRWIERLDQGGQDSSDRQLYIYFVQNGKAADLAPVLGQVFGDDSSASAAVPTGELAPGLEPVEIASTGQPAAGGETPAPTAAPTAPTPAPSSASGISLSSGGSTRIVADEERNALLISGTAREYRAVLRALKQLDRRPLEVLIEVTIADVTLSNRLEYGIRWFFQTDSGRHAISQTDLDDTGLAGVAAVAPGLSYVYSATNAKAVLDLLSSVTDVEVISAPQLLVLNNQEAQLQVGEQVPVLTGEETTSSGGLATTVELKDVGVILNVTPRVNDSGLIILDIEQEVSQVSEDASAGSLTPTISKRIVTTSVAVQSGQTVALGGMIQDNRNNTKVGVPILSKIPFLGALFRYTTDTVSRSELLVLVSPRIIRDERDALEATAELRRRMEDLERLERKIDRNE